MRMGPKLNCTFGFFSLVFWPDTFPSTCMCYFYNLHYKRLGPDPNFRQLRTPSIFCQSLVGFPTWISRLIILSFNLSALLFGTCFLLVTQLQQLIKVCTVLKCICIFRFVQIFVLEMQITRSLPPLDSTTICFQLLNLAVYNITFTATLQKPDAHLQSAVIASPPSQNGLQKTANKFHTGGSTEVHNRALFCHSSK